MGFTTCLNVPFRPLCDLGLVLPHSFKLQSNETQLSWFLFCIQLFLTSGSGVSSKCTVRVE